MFGKELGGSIKDLQSAFRIACAHAGPDWIFKTMFLLLS
jgi:hypothetical protein